MPQEMLNPAPKGKIWFYCAYNAGQDKHFELKTDEAGKQSFPTDAVPPGNYLVKLTWEKDGLNYYAEKNITVQ